MTRKVANGVVEVDGKSISVGRLHEIITEVTESGIGLSYADAQRMQNEGVSPEGLSLTPEETSVFGDYLATVRLTELTSGLKGEDRQFVQELHNERPGSKDRR